MTPERKRQIEDRWATIDQDLADPSEAKVLSGVEDPASTKTSSSISRSRLSLSLARRISRNETPAKVRPKNWGAVC